MYVHTGLWGPAANSTNLTLIYFEMQILENHFSSFCHGPSTFIGVYRLSYFTLFVLAIKGMQKT